MAAPSAPNGLIKRTTKGVASFYAVGSYICDSITCCAWYNAESVDAKIAELNTQITNLRTTIKQKDGTIAVQQQTINADMMYRRNDGRSYAGSAFKLYRTDDGKDYRVNSRDDVQVPVRDLQELEQKIVRLQNTVLDASADAVEAGARLKESKEKDNESQRIIEAQATVIRNQSIQIRELETLYASPFMVLGGVQIVPSVFVAPGQIVTAPGKMYVTHDFNVTSLQKQVNDLTRRNENQYKVLSDVLAALKLNDLKQVAPAIRTLQDRAAVVANVLGVQEGQSVVAVAERVRASNKQLQERNDNQFQQIQVLRSERTASEARAKELSEHKNSYMAIIAEIRKALGINEVSPGTEIIAYAKQVVLQRDVANREVRDLQRFLRQKNADQQARLTTIAGLRSKLDKLAEIVDRRWDYSKGSYNHNLHMAFRLDDMRDVIDTQPTTGSTQQAPSGRNG